MDDSLEALLEKATNPKNKYEDWEFIMAFCDRVNADPEGPIIALRIIVPKMRHENEKVALLSLTLLEACVKNCGQRFHQELGKFRFLNELIRMISPKYLGRQTPPTVQKKIQELLYSWKLGLPLEPKIADAYEMLKKEGLMFDETKPADATLVSTPAKPRIALIEDPKHSDMLQKLLGSKSPEDLRAANRLIREMVRRDEKRMDRLQQRMEQLDLIQNNIKLLNELLSHYKPETGGEQERLLIKELYSSLEKLRPTLFKMASELKQHEEGMSEILETNERLIRVTDLYRRLMGETKTTTSTSATATSTTTTTTAMDTTATTSTSAAVPTASATAASGGEGSSVLIDLADLNFGPPPTTQGAANTSTSSSLLDDLGLLGMPPPVQPTSQALPPFNIPPLMTSPPAPTTISAFPLSHKPPTAVPSTSPLITIPPPPSQRAPVGQVSQVPTNDPFSSFLLGNLASLTLTSPATQPPSRGPAANIQSAPPIGGLVPNIQPVPKSGGPAANIQHVPPTGGPAQNVHPVAPIGGSSPSDPLAVLNDVFVPLDSIQPGSLPPLQVMNKNGITVSFHFAKNFPAPNVSVIVISTISTSPITVNNFQFQAAVPKVMRVKLQPPTSTELATYNPVLPPSSVSQVMLLANPNKAKIRLKYRISYSQMGQEVVEMGEVSDFPAL